ncbi:MAG: glutathione-disulfide reductase [Immundisolibacter sp.]|uniref:glutathione-disulfide reductase n=1 Tax=Immundisolibacter sp. TaxID=1934948 RepID=UPI003D13E41B
MSERFDYLVIGGGSGGIASARRAAQYGARVAVVEAARLGGTCVNVGCVPKKVMWNAAGIAESLHHAAGYGFDLGEVRFDWLRLVQARHAYIERLNGIYGRMLDESGVTLLRGHARFVAPDAVTVDGATYRARHILIAAGGRPDVPNLPGAELGIDSDGFFALAAQPRRVAVIGAGYIAVELAGVLRALGSTVTLAIRGQTVLRSFDALVQEAVTGHLEGARIALERGFVPAGLERRADGITVRAADGRAASGFDCVIWAVGRRPCSDQLGLETTGVETDAVGHIPVDAFQDTNVPGIHAVGDITGRAPLTPVAIAAGRRLADRLFDGQSERHLNYDDIPSVVFAHPPVGTVGLTEAQARERHGDAVRVYTTRFTDMYYALGSHKPQTVAKLVCVGVDERVVGVHVVGRGADEMTQGFAVAVKLGARKRDLDDTVAIHPTASEELVLMR